MAKGSSGGARYGQQVYGVKDGNSTGMPQGNSGGKLMNGTPPTNGGNPPMPPKGTSACYGGDGEAQKGQGA